MNRRTFLKTLPALSVLAGTASGFAQGLQPVTLIFCGRHSG
ncbi:MAG: twin-arginine translocation signal domain-containing protein [Planctomycetota bacterium]